MIASEPSLLWPLLIGLAILMGFVADRTNLCTVSAVMEVVTERKADTLWNITKIVLWILGFVVLVDFFFDIAPDNRNNFVLSWVSIGGGLVFGMGAALNGGCSLQMITRLGRGNLGTAFSIAGLPLGAVLARLLLERAPALTPVRATESVMLEGNLRLVLVIGFSAWMLWELARVLRGFRLSECPQRLLAADYLPGSSAALLGIANGALFSLVGTWMFTYTLIQSLTNLAYPNTDLYMPISPLLWWLLGAYLLGIIGSAIQSRHAILQARPELLWIRYFFGGVLMGLGASLVPGGNDMILMNGIPGLSSHALPAYGAMLVGIALVLMVMMRVMPAAGAGEDRSD